MRIDTEMMDNQGLNLPYDKPVLHKYGTMKDLTNGYTGSGGDIVGQRPIGDELHLNTSRAPNIDGSAG